jgi:hypothetical protein
VAGVPADTETPAYSLNWDGQNLTPTLKAGYRYTADVDISSTGDRYDSVAIYLPERTASNGPPALYMGPGTSGGFNDYDIFNAVPIGCGASTQIKTSFVTRGGIPELKVQLSSHGVIVPVETFELILMVDPNTLSPSVIQEQELGSATGTTYFALGLSLFAEEYVAPPGRYTFHVYYAGNDTYEPTVSPPITIANTLPLPS